MVVGMLLSYWDGLFSGAMLNLGGVFHPIEQNNQSKGFPMISPQQKIHHPNASQPYTFGLFINPSERDLNHQRIMAVSTTTPSDYPTKREKENHLQKWLLMGYVSSQEGILHPLVCIQIHLVSPTHLVPCPKVSGAHRYLKDSWGQGQCIES